MNTNYINNIHKKKGLTFLTIPAVDALVISKLTKVGRE